MVYLAISADRRFMKIGSSIDPVRRMYGLRRAALHQGLKATRRFRLYAVAPGGLDLEARLIMDYEKFRVRGREWLRFSGDVISRFLSLPGVSLTCERKFREAPTVLVRGDLHARLREYANSNGMYIFRVLDRAILEYLKGKK